MSFSYIDPSLFFHLIFLLYPSCYFKFQLINNLLLLLYLILHYFILAHYFMAVEI